MPVMRREAVFRIRSKQEGGALTSSLSSKGLYSSAVSPEPVAALTEGSLAGVF